jgi:hypothetical protein
MSNHFGLRLISIFALDLYRRFTPNQVATLVHHNKGMIIDINIEPNTFTNLALSAEKGYFIKQPSSVALPSILDVFKTCKVS